jgi:CheY-like chemotaxis protein
MLAENDAQVRQQLSEGLRHDGLDVVAVEDGAHVKSYIDDCVFADALSPRVDAIVTELHIPGMNGVELLSYMHDLDWDLPLLVILHDDDPALEAQARAYGASACLSAPVTLQGLEDALLRVLSRA